MPKTALSHDSFAMQLRQKLVDRANRYIEEQKVTQVMAAQAMGVSQPRISDLKRGKCEKFSLDMLVTMLHRVGIEVDLVV